MYNCIGKHVRSGLLKVFFSSLLEYVVVFFLFNVANEVSNPKFNSIIMLPTIVANLPFITNQILAMSFTVILC